MGRKLRTGSAAGKPTVVAEAEYERELEVFRSEVSVASQFFYAYLTVHDVAKDVPAVFDLLNTAPLFWNTNLGGLQTATFIALGRIFDQASTHNIDRVLRIAQGNRHFFSKAALGDRKRRASPDNIAWLDSYLRTAYVPKASDFRRLRKLVGKYRKIYESNYRDLRRKIFAHTEVSDGTEVDALFAKTSVRELQRLLVFLDSLYDALYFQLFLNGRKPVLRKRRYSVRRMRAKPSQKGLRNSVQERLTHEVERFLRAAAGLVATRSYVRRSGG
jgi:AbiU2